jgi:endonuclease YncB( thermonuclease family)
VDRVIDGDTITCTSREKVRLLRIDTPESDEALYEEASAALRNLLPRGSSVKLELEGRPKDPYGRTLAYVFKGDNNVCLQMVLSGWSKYDTRFGYGRYRRQFQDAERRAERGRLGLWAISGSGSGSL